VVLYVTRLQGCAVACNGSKRGGWSVFHYLCVCDCCFISDTGALATHIHPPHTHFFFSPAGCGRLWSGWQRQRTAMC
jgi:hypothetical protein